MAQFVIPDLTGQNHVFQAQRVTLFVGPNGSGKSSLLSQIYRQVAIGNNGEFFPGHRQVITSNDNFDSLGQTLDQLSLSLISNPNHFSRSRSAWPEDVYKAGIKRFTNSVNDFNSSYVAAVESGSNASLEEVKSRPASLDRLNHIMESANLMVRFVASGGGLKVIRGNSSFGIDRMSDGERAVISVIAAILTRKPGDCVLIDEPERHLHPSICGPLWLSTVKAREDLKFFFASHDLELINWLSPELLIQVSESVVVNLEPESRLFEFHKIENADELSDTLKSSILGARRGVLSVEGEKEDARLYQLLFPDWTVRSVGGADSVISETRALRASSNLNWLQSRGLIDGDGRDAVERALLERDGIYALSCPTIENLIFSKPIVEILAKISEEAFGGDPGEARVARLEIELRAHLVEHREEIIARRVVWYANREISATKIDMGSARRGILASKSVDIESIRKVVKEEVDNIIKAPAFESVALLPIKNSRIPALIGKAVGYDSKRRYYDTIVSHISRNTAFGSELRYAFRLMVPPIVF